MACEDPKRREFMKVASGAVYELSVDGPAGFAAFANFDDGHTATIETWPFKDISPGPKKKKLSGAGKVHVVFIHVNIDGTKNIEVTVKVSVDGKEYCRTVRGKRTQEIIVHTIRMAA
jgi:hypothetical protein